MKLTKGQLPELMGEHIFHITEEQLNSLAFLLDIKITDYKKIGHKVSFKMTQKLTTVFVECGCDSCASIGRSNKVKNGLSGLTSWGGVFSFAQIVGTFRAFFSGGYELTISSPEVLKVYEKKEWEDIVLYANDLVEA